MKRGKPVGRYPMKPETIARRKRERAIKVAERSANLTERFRELAEEEGPDSIWAEMLAEREAQGGTS